jgi:hypothetical protein
MQSAILGALHTAKRSAFRAEPKRQSFHCFPLEDFCNAPNKKTPNTLIPLDRSSPLAIARVQLGPFCTRRFGWGQPLHA